MDNKKSNRDFFELEYCIHKVIIRICIELVENDFYFEVKVNRDGKEYSVSDRKSHLESYYIDNSICFESIFNFTQQPEDEYIHEREKWERKRHNIFKWKEAANSRAKLYANLILSALENIQEWSS